MTDKPRRPWFQINLSTAIVLMVVAGGLLWANLSPKPGMGHEIVPIPPQQGIMFHVRATRTSYGWPSLCFDQYGQDYRFWSYSALGVNGALALSILGGAALTCEWFIRRREARAT